MNLQILLLAAGSSSRLGQPKQLVLLNGETLLEKAAKAALSVRPGSVTVVLGACFETIAPVLAGLPVAIFQHLDWAQGMGSSIRAGVAAVLEQHPSTDAVLLLQCDQPLLDAGLLQKIVDTGLSATEGIVAAAYGGSSGPPVLFKKKYFGPLAHLDPAKGAKPLLLRFQEDLRTVDFPGGEVDVDTADDLERLLNLPKLPPLQP